MAFDLHPHGTYKVLRTLIFYSVIVRILEDEQEYDWMVYRRSKQIVPRTKGFEKFYHTCEEIGRGTQG